MSAYQRATLDWQLASMRGDRIGALQAARARGGIDVGVEALRANHPGEAVDALAGSSFISDAYYHWLTLVEAYHMLGNFESELAEAQRGREAYPGRLRMLEGEVRALAALGDTDQVRARLDASVRLAPDDGFSPGDVMIGAAAELRAHGFGEASLDAAERAVEWYRSRPAEETTTGWYRYSLAHAYYLRESWEEARQLFEELASEAPADVNLQGFLGVLAARRGDSEAARRISESLPGTAARGDFGRDVYWQACIASLLGEREWAMELLRDAYARGRAFAVFLHRDMDLEPLRDYPPFQEFIAPKG
jgi:tetratricopeptide (TPR) repeat protein